MTNRTRPTLLKILLALGIFFVVKYLVPYGNTILYPINLLVTFLHEFGHAMGAVLTGGSVDAIQINSDGSGFCRTGGGLRAIVLMGGYLGSAVFGNLLLYIGLRKPNWARYTMDFIAIFLIFTAVWWFNSVSSSLILFLFACGFIYLANKKFYHAEILAFIGMASTLFILEDFNIGPSSDLARYADIFVVIPTIVWTYIWLFTALAMSYYTINRILKEAKREGK